MNKRFIAKAAVCVIVAAVTVIAGKISVKAAAPEIRNYSGDASNPHLITNKYELASIGSNQFGKKYPLDGNYLQINDIVFTAEDFQEGGDFYNEGKGWKPIGGSASTEQFKGIYDGNRFAIENIYINRSDEAYVGIFAYAGDTSKLFNLGNKNGNITGGNYVGGLTGTGFSIIDNCYNTGAVESVFEKTEFTGTGGIVGGESASITNCYNLGAIKSKIHSAGLMGRVSVSRVKIDNCYNKGEIIGTVYASGIANFVTSNSFPISNCYNTGKVSGKNAGGIVAESCTMQNCYNTGDISGEIAGGICGQNGQVSKSFNTGNITGTKYAGGIVAKGSGYVESCFNTGIVQGGQQAGGIIGYGNRVHPGDPNVKNSYNRGKISGTNAAGIANNALRINNCYNGGEVIGENMTGGIATYDSGGIAPILTSSYFDREASKLEEAYPGNETGKLATDQMTGTQSLNTMTGLNTESQFVVNTNGYPELKIFKQNINAFIREISDKSVQVGEIENPGGGENPDNPGEPEKPGEDGSTANGEIIGTVKPAQIKAVVPTIITFEIDPSKTLDYEGAAGDDSFISPSFTMQNAGTVPLDFSIDSITAQNSMPSVVAENKYTSENWQTLSKGDTNGNISFGFIMDDKTQWASAVNPNNWYGNVKYPFGTINSNGQAQLHLKGKYGLNWGNALAKKITYDVVYKVEVVE